MSVFENLLVGAVHSTKLGYPGAAERIGEVLELTGLDRHRFKMAGELSLLDLKRLELAKALSQNPKLLLLDEIAGGLTDAECRSLLEIVRSVWQAGTTIIWIEHVLHALRSIAGRMVVLNGGQFIIDGTPDAVLASDELREVYLGG